MRFDRIHCYSTQLFLAIEAIISAFIATNLSCITTSRILPPNASQQLASWFVTPMSTRLDSLNAMQLNQLQIDSLFRACRCTDQRGGRFVLSLSDSSGCGYRLGFAVPAAFRCDSAYPLIVYLHGGTGVADAIKGERAWEMLMPLTDSMVLFLASPSANRDAPWWSSIGLARILQTVRFMTLRYPIDPKRIFLAGVSDGAAGCYAAASTIWGPFAGFIAISGSGLILQQMGFPLQPSNIAQRPFYNIYAGNDHLYPADLTRRFIESLRAEGVDIIESFHPTEGHGFDYCSKEWPALTRLLRTWRRPLHRYISAVLTPSFPFAGADGLICWQATAENGTPSFVRVGFQSDTMVVNSGGLRSFTVAITGEFPHFLRINGGFTRRLTPTSISTRLQLSLCMTRCRPPEVAEEDLYFFNIHVP